MFFLYKIFLAFIFPFLILFIFLESLIKKNKFKIYLQKFAIFKPKIIPKERIWLHGVSAGEVTLIKGFIPHLQEKLLISTSTENGWIIAKQIQNKYPQQILIHYFPFDYKFICRKMISTILPKAILIMEGEIWPHFIQTAYENNIPCYLINLKLSEKAYWGYYLFKHLFKKVLSYYSHFYVQTSSEIKYLTKLEVKKNKITLCNNLKLEIIHKNYSLKESISSLKILSKKIIVAGSTHKGEEKIIVQAYKKLVNYSNAILILAPRNPKRSKKLRKKLLLKGFNSIIFDSNLIKLNLKKLIIKKNTIILIENFGELNSFYKIADLVIIGGSFIKNIGGHNIFEPLLLGKITIIGPYTKNYQFIIENLIKTNGIYQINNTPLSTELLKRLLFYIKLEKKQYLKIIKNTQNHLNKYAKMTKIISHKILSNI